MDASTFDTAQPRAAIPRRPQRPVALGDLATAVAATAAAGLLQWIAWPLIEGMPFLFFYAAVMVSGWKGDWRAAALSIGLSAVAADALFMRPGGGGPITLAHVVSVLFFVAICVLMTSLNVRQRHLRARLQGAIADSSRPRAQLEAVFQSISDGVMVFDTAGRAVMVNDAEARLAGYPTAADMKKDLSHFAAVFELRTPDGTLLPVEAWPVCRVMRGEALVDFELLGRRRDTGQEWFFSYSGAPVRDETGAQVLSVLVTRDVSRRVRSERTLKDSQLLLQSTMNDFPTTIAFMDTEDRFVDVNPAVERTLGRPKAEIIGKTLSDFIPKEAAEVLYRHAAEVRRTRRAVQREETTPLLEGTLVSLDTAFPLVDGEGRVYGTGHISHDITELRRAEEALRGNEEQFRTLANSIPQLAWIAQPDGSIHWYNQRWYDYTGTTPAEMEQEGGAGWKRVHDPAALPRTLAHYQEALAAGAPWEDTFVLRRRDGQFRWHLSRAMPVRDANGRITRWFGTNTDIEDQRRMAAALREALHVRDDFLSVAGHELRTPLSALRLHLQSAARALKKESAAPRVIDRLDKAIAASRRLEALVNTLLDVSRIQAGRLELEHADVDLVALVTEVVDRHAEHAESLGVSLSVAAPPELVVKGDRSRLDQVVTNLLSNAIKYGRGAPVELELAPRSEEAILRVTDHGVGIAPPALQRVFERFERAAVSTDSGGIGLGLWITRSIVEASGGGITVHSELGRGTTFTVTLPLHHEVVHVSA